MNRFESKYFATAEKMDEALVKLLEKKPFEYITVKELCTEAGVNRSTFYLHYENTRDLLSETAARLTEKFFGVFGTDPNQKGDSGVISKMDPKELIFIKPEYIIPYLNFMKDNRKVFAVAMKNYDNFEFGNIYGRLFKYFFDPVLEKFEFPESERKYVMTFYLSGINAVVTAWLENDCAESVEEISDIIFRCIMDKRENAV